jgi:hypothetical protein
MLDMGAETYVAVFVKCPLLLSSFMKIHLVVLELSHLDTRLGGANRHVFCSSFYEFADVPIMWWDLMVCE